MGLPRNVEKHSTIGGCYTVYDADGYAWRVAAAHPGWAGRPSHVAAMSDARWLRADTLRALAARIAASRRAENASAAK